MDWQNLLTYLNALQVELPWWGYIVVVLALTHVTIISVTVFLHRSQAHRALDIHPLASHFFRFWLWLTTATITKEWVAVHRKHHARCETPEDPHSPQIVGIKRVLLCGAELYRDEAKNAQTLEKFGLGTPDDWLERHLYSPRSHWGITLMLVIDIMLFGAIGLTIWAIQMLWIPIHAAGIINGIGHYWGYRNFSAADTSTNIVPWGIWIGGEELHNNHHAYASSAKLSNRWYEFDIGWMYIRIMQLFGLAKVRRIAPKIKFDWNKQKCDLDTLQAVITHRFDVMSQYANMLRKAYTQEMQTIRSVLKEQQIMDFSSSQSIKDLLHLDQHAMQEKQRALLQVVLNSSNKLKTIYEARQDLLKIWARSTLPQEQLLHDLEVWCVKAETSGIQAMKEFSSRLRSYQLESQMLS